MMWWHGALQRTMLFWGLEVMDGTRFDGLSRLLAGAGSRRGALKAALGLIAGGSALAVGEASARPALCRPAGRYCTSNRQCCNNRCRIGKRVPLASRNICDCDAPQAMCGKMCRDLSSDPNHCGGCGNKIDRDSELCCDGVPTAIDEANCHACGEVCGPDDVCCGPEIGCAASCEPEVSASCVGGNAVGGACTAASDCCSLVCSAGVCVSPSADCTTFDGTDPVITTSGFAYCFRGLGDDNGSVVEDKQLFCRALATPRSYGEELCTSHEDCQSYLATDGITTARGMCLDQMVTCDIFSVPPHSCTANIASGAYCVFFYTDGTTCSN